jgi:hypothetical protein
MAPRKSKNRMTSALLAACLVGSAMGEHHMKWKVEKRQGGSTNIPLVVTNNCAETIYPGIHTQGGTGPSASGYEF